MKVEILDRDTDSVLYSGEHESLREVLEHAVKGDIDLSRAELAGAELSEANLQGARLSDADLRGSQLVGCVEALRNTPAFVLLPRCVSKTQRTLLVDQSIDVAFTRPFFKGFASIGRDINRWVIRYVTGATSASQENQAGIAPQSHRGVNRRTWLVVHVAGAT